MSQLLDVLGSLTPLERAEVPAVPLSAGRTPHFGRADFCEWAFFRSRALSDTILTVCSSFSCTQAERHKSDWERKVKTLKLFASPYPYRTSSDDVRRRVVVRLFRWRSEKRQSSLRDKLLYKPRNAKSGTWQWQSASEGQVGFYARSPARISTFFETVNSGGSRARTAIASLSTSSNTSLSSPCCSFDL
jgi:hypothetical protein